MSVEIAVQTAIRARLIASAGVTSLVPADHIIDRNQRPVGDPSIVLGEDQTVDESESFARDRVRVYSTLHIWKKEPSTSGVKTIAWAIRAAVRPGRLQLGSGFHCVDCRAASSRFLRDPDGETSHGVVVVETLVQEVADA